ncbi:MAG: hypothetical protein V4513_07885 [Pseudomonadota bacterium]
MRKHYILDAAASLLGVSLIIVTAFHISGTALSTLGDELAFSAAVLFIVSCLLSHRGISKDNERYEHYADKFFASGILFILASVVTVWL